MYDAGGILNPITYIVDTFTASGYIEVCQTSSEHDAATFAALRRTLIIGPECVVVP